jgi:hypothetical protein
MMPKISTCDLNKLLFVQTVKYDRNRGELSLLTGRGTPVHFEQDGDDHIVAKGINGDDVGELLIQLDKLHKGTGFLFEPIRNNASEHVVIFSLRIDPYQPVAAGSRPSSTNTTSRQ